MPDGSEDDFLYTGYNFHWETRNIALPNLPEGMEWKKVMDTGDLTCDGFYGGKWPRSMKEPWRWDRVQWLYPGVKKPETERKHTGKGKKNEKLPGAEAKKTAASDNTVTEAENKGKEVRRQCIHGFTLKTITKHKLMVMHHCFRIGLYKQGFSMTFPNILHRNFWWAANIIGETEVQITQNVRILACLPPGSIIKGAISIIMSIGWIIP